MCYSRTEHWILVGQRIAEKIDERWQLNQSRPLPMQTHPRAYTKQKACATSGDGAAFWCYPRKMKRKPRPDIGGQHYMAPRGKHRIAAKLILMGYSKYAAMRAVGYSHGKARLAPKARCLRVAIREAFLDQHRGPM